MQPIHKVLNFTCSLQGSLFGPEGQIAIYLIIYAFLLNFYAFYAYLRIIVDALRIFMTTLPRPLPPPRPHAPIHKGTLHKGEGGRRPPPPCGEGRPKAAPPPGWVRGGWGRQRARQSSHKYTQSVNNDFPRWDMISHCGISHPTAWCILKGAS